MFWLLQIVTNRQFAKAFGGALWRPALIPIPVFVLNAAFSEERAKMMTEGQKVIPKRTLAYGFQYKYPDIDTACRQVAKLIPPK
jgi:NAD dependent epimerase/dehydratase family enzyme